MRKRDRPRLDRNDLLTPTDIEALVNVLQNPRDKALIAMLWENASGGLLVLGISSDGKPKGVRHLTEDQQKDIAAVHQLLVNHAAQVKHVPFQREDGDHDQLILIHVPTSTARLNHKLLKHGSLFSVHVYCTIDRLCAGRSPQCL